MGKTYDPVVFKTLKVNGLTPDPALALTWYGKAATAGQVEAGAAMAALKAATQ
jgi:TPR repeat protein